MPKEPRIDIDPYNSDYWFPDQADFIHHVQLNKSNHADFFFERRAKGPLAERVKLEEEKENTKIIYSEYKRAKLSSGYLEYIDNDPEGNLNDALPMVFIHGFLGHAFEFKPYLEFFKDKVRCISISILGLERHFPKPEDINAISPKSFCDLIVELMTVKFNIKRFVLVGHSFGAIISQMFVYHYQDVVAGVCFICYSSISSHLGFLAYNNTSYGLMRELYQDEWDTIKDKVNDKEFQTEFRAKCNEAVKMYYEIIYLDSKVVNGNLIPFNYQIPDDPYEHMVAFAYCRTYFRSVYEIGTKLPKILKMFLWGESDFVADKKRVSESVYRYTRGDLKIHSDSEFFQKIKGAYYLPATKDAINRIYSPKLDGSFSSYVIQIKNNPEYFVKKQEEHCHGFVGEGHNAHTKRYKFIIPSLFSYYKDILVIEHIKSLSSAKM